jgi:putative endonuclease
LGAVSRLRAAGSAAQLAPRGGRRPAALLGKAGERAAAEFLRKRGYEVVGAGFLARRGELDLVCLRRGELVVVEVKTRAGDAFGTPFEGVGAKKRRSLLAAAAEYRALAEWRGAIRFAVVGVTPRADGGFAVELLEDPFG